jgi:hypothetical protein
MTQTDALCQLLKAAQTLAYRVDSLHHYDGVVREMNRAGQTEPLSEALEDLDSVIYDIERRFSLPIAEGGFDG